MAGVWDAAIQATLQELDTRKLLRVQRPTIPVLSSSEVGRALARQCSTSCGLVSHQRSTPLRERGPQAQISQDALEAWADGRAPLDSSEATQTHNHPSGPRGDSHPSSAPSSSAESSTQGTVASQTALSPLAPQSLRLFSLNDYLGLASHPDVCRAAADAAMQVRQGICAAWQSAPPPLTLTQPLPLLHPLSCSRIAALFSGRCAVVAPASACARVCVVLRTVFVLPAVRYGLS